MKPNETWTCTFNNTTNTGTIKVIKKVDGVQVAGWTVDAHEPECADDGDAGFGGDRRRVATVDFALSKVVDGGSSVHLAEQRQAGYTPAR